MAIDVSSAPPYPTGNTLHRLAQLGQVIAPPIATGLAYLFAAKAGAWLAFPSAPVSALWAPNAILLAALLLARRERWWIYLIVVLPFHLFAQLPDVPIARVAIQYVANVAEAVLGAWAILRFCPEPRRFNRLRTIVVLILMAGVVAPAVTSLLMVGAFALAGIAADYWLTALVRTITNTFAITALVPLIVHGVDGFRAGRQQVSLWRILEATLLTVLLAAVCIVIFALPADGSVRSAAWLFAPLPLLAWATIRFRVSGACSAALVVGAISTWGVLNGHGPFDVANPIENALSIVSFHVMICVTFVFFAALLEEWRHASRALGASEGLHAAVIGSVQDQIAVLDSAGRIIEVNESWRRAVQLAHPARFDRVLANQSYFDACAHAAESGQHTATEQLAALCDVLAGRETRRHFEYQEPAGMEQAWIEVTIEKLQRPEGGAVITRTDISARKRSEHEARVQQQQLTHLGRAAVLGQLSGAFAHELNQPLTSILSNAEAALRMIASGNVDPEEIEEILCDIVHADLRASQVIDRLRSLLEKGDFLRRPVDLNAIVGEVLDLAKSELITRHVRVGTSLDGRAPVVMADRVQMQQIVLNLIMNACDAMSGMPVADRKVELITCYLPDESCVEVTVKDRGCGVPAGELDRIFQPFVTSKSHGMGMGLAICRSVAEAHRGQLWAESTPGFGATFHLRIPLGGALQ